MGVEKFRGIVLKEYPSGESSKRIVVLTETMGKVTLNAKGARNSKSKLLSASQLFCYSDFSVYEGKNFYSITQAEIIESFYGLRKDIVKLAFATYLLELTEKTQLEGDASIEVLRLLLRTLTVIEKTEFDVLLAVSIFEIKYLQLNGFFDYKGNCVFCGKGFDSPHFSPKGGGLICEDCAVKFHDSRPLLKGTFKAVKHVLENDRGRIFSFKVSEEVSLELRIILEEYIKENIGRGFNTLDFAKSCLME